MKSLIEQMTFLLLLEDVKYDFKISSLYLAFSEYRI